MSYPATSLAIGCDACGCVGPHFCTGGQVKSKIYQMSFEEALEAVEAHATPEWKTEALRIVEDICRTHAEFTTDEVWKVLDRTPWRTREHRALGSIMIQAARKGWIVKTDRVRNTERPEAHSRPLAIWQSLRYFPSLP